MNQQRRADINDAFQDLFELIQEERQTLENQEESFSQTEKWQEADLICTDAEGLIEDLEECLTRWEIR